MIIGVWFIVTWKTLGLSWNLKDCENIYAVAVTYYYIVFVQTKLMMKYWNVKHTWKLSDLPVSGKE